ncbi:MAG: SDR family oxidoreductase [Acidimicrobiales bacterium]
MRIAVAGGAGMVGRYVVEAATAAGHDVVVLARSKGVDVHSGDGLVSALGGVDAVVDATNAATTEEAPATAFFTASTASLQRAGAEQGVRHLVVLSIVGIDRAPTGYYAAKAAHEHAALGGPVPATVLRATQFHEFSAQMIAWNRKGSVAHIPALQVQSVAARTVGAALAALATATPNQRVADLAGPERGDLVTLARRLSEHLRLGIDVQPVESRVPEGALLPTNGARIEGPTFEQWLSTADAASAATAMGLA